MSGARTSGRNGRGPVGADLRRWARRRAVELRGRDDEGVALITALLLIMLLTTLSIAVLGLMLAEIKPTQFGRKNTRTVFAAEAGVEAALSQLRTAQSTTPDVTGKYWGQTSQLPCTVTGSVSDSSGPLSYTVTVQYYRLNPAGKSASWLSANAMVCTPGSGVTGQPSYAQISSAGSDAGGGLVSATQANRTMISVYRFQTTTTNVKGGYIYSFGDNYCLRANGVTAGSTIAYIAKASCGTDTMQNQELWLYDTDYMLKLAFSTTAGQTPLCIAGPFSTTNPAGKATLQACKATSDPNRWYQLWSWEGGAHWRGENTGITDYSGYYLSVQGGSATTVSNGALLYVTTGAASNNEWGSFDPDPAVGAGAASYDTHQIVNYLEFGRCLDVTNEQIASAFMISYPCKQDPSGGTKLLWNHKWYYTEPSGSTPSLSNQQIYVLQYNSPTSKYCLQSPGTVGGFVTFTSACNAADPNQAWTRNKDTGDYSTSYTFTVGTSDPLHPTLCLGLSPTKYSGAWSEIIVTTCTGGLDQKWNAPPDVVTASVGNYKEVSGG